MPPDVSTGPLGDDDTRAGDESRAESDDEPEAPAGEPDAPLPPADTEDGAVARAVADLAAKGVVLPGNAKPKGRR